MQFDRKNCLRKELLEGGQRQLSRQGSTSMTSELESSPRTSAFRKSLDGQDPINYLRETLSLHFSHQGLGGFFNEALCKELLQSFKDLLEEFFEPCPLPQDGPEVKARERIVRDFPNSFKASYFEGIQRPWLHTAADSPREEGAGKKEEGFLDHYAAEFLRVLIIGGDVFKVSEESTEPFSDMARKGDAMHASKE